MQVRIGCGPQPHNRKQFHADFGIAEVHETYNNPFTQATITRWRADAPKSHRFVLMATHWLTADPLDMKRSEAPPGLNAKNLGFLRPTEENMQVWQAMRTQAQQFNASHVLLNTPASFSPSRQNREAMTEFIRTVSANDLPFRLVWEPRGFWEHEESVAFAEELGIGLAFDPYTDDKLPDPPKGQAYYVLTAPHGRRLFDADDCEDLADYFEEHEAPIIAMFRGPEREKNARRLKEVLDERAEELADDLAAAAEAAAADAEDAAADADEAVDE